MNNEYVYQEKQSYLNRTFTNEYGTENDTVHFNYWERYYYMNDTKDDKMLTILNLGILGAWYNMKTAPWSTAALLASSTLITNINDII